jgi:hypothetical protein
MISPCKPPLSLPAPKPKRLPSVKCMTITVGFVCADGIVLGADSQESFDGSVLKRSVSKLTVFPPLESEYSKTTDRRAAFTGSGNSQLIDKLIEEMTIEVASAGASIKEMAAAIEKRTKQMYREYRNLYHAGYMPEAEITYGLWCGDKSALFHAQGPIVKEIGTVLHGKTRKGLPPLQTRIGYKATGQGNEITDYINARMALHPGLSTFGAALNLGDAIVVATYMLEQAVAHASGCGGDIRIVWLANDGTADMVDTGNYTSALLKGLDQQLSRIFLATANSNLPDREMDRVWDEAKQILLWLREKYKQGAEKTQKDKEVLSNLLQDLLDNPEKYSKKSSD